MKAESVLVVEGEGDVETARKLGLTSTCNAQGAGKWKPEYSESLRGKHVVIIADADAPGLRHARDVAHLLVAVAGSVKLIEALPGGGKDLTDFVERGGTREQLLALIAEAKELTPASVASWSQPLTPVPGVLASKVKAEKVSWLWPNHIPRGKVTIFDGDPGLGKSTVTLDLAARLTRGFTMPDSNPTGISPAGVVIVSLEAGLADTIVPRQKAAGADLSKARIIQTIAGPDGVDRTPTLPIDLPAIEAAIEDVSAALLVLDPLVGTLGADTNTYKNQDIRRALAPLAALAEKTGVAVVAIRHLSKGNNQNPKYRGGGSIGIIGAARASFIFAENPDEPGAFIMAPNKLNLCAKP
ncbi:MAG: AAA family ATPase, partial [Gammaproteobacteria bacterium]